MDNKTIDPTQYMKDSMSFFEQIIKGEGLGLSEEQKKLFNKELEKNGALNSYDKLKEEIKKMSVNK